MTIPKIFRRAAALILAAIIWVPCVHLLVHSNDAVPTDSGLSVRARELETAQIALWSDKAARERSQRQMRLTNPEWDFMGRSYLAWSMANIALREPSQKKECLRVMDEIIDDTIATEHREGLYYFLMPYAHDRDFVQQPAGSQFLDGEIASMIGMRRVVEEKAAYVAPMRERLERITRRMEASPSLSAESYPNECWMFCNSVALDALVLSDYLDHTDHRDLERRWIDNAKRKLTNPRDGLLISSYALDGTATAGPQGSSIFMVAHCLKIVDPAFAEDQYRRARRELGKTFVGFGYASEWTSIWGGPQNVDSGTVISGLDISPGATGMAALAAASFHDEAYLRSIMAVVDYGAFPQHREGGVSYLASNQVGDAVLLYALVQGPVWDRVLQGRGGKL